MSNATLYGITINGIVDLVFVFPREQVDWSPTIKETVSAVQNYYFAHIEPRHLALFVCECDNPNSHKDRVGRRKQ